MPPTINASVAGAFAEVICSRTSSRLRCLRAPRIASAQSGKRSFSSSLRAQEDRWLEDGQSQSTARPRWSHTPERMTAPVSLKRHDPENRYDCNEDPAVLDAVYARVLGDGGEKLLTDEVKWLAVTHKSFDQGRRGYNDRLAFLGKKILPPSPSLLLTGDV